MKISLKASAQCAEYKRSIRKILGKEQRAKAKKPKPVCHYRYKQTYMNIITFKYIIKYK